MISKNRVKILYGSLPRAEVDQIIQTCNVCNDINQHFERVSLIHTTYEKLIIDLKLVIDRNLH